MPTTRGGKRPIADSAPKPAAKKAEKKSWLRDRVTMLTYTKVGADELTHHSIIGFLNSVKTLEEYSCGREPHDETKEGYDPEHPWHYHVYVAFGKAPNFKDPHCLDITTSTGRKLHPNVSFKDPKYKQTPADRRRHLILYTQKGEQSHEEFEEYNRKPHNDPRKGPNYGVNADYETSGDLLGDDSGQTQLTKRQVFGMYRDAETVEEGAAIMREHDPEQWYKYGATMERQKRAEIGGFEATPYTLDEFESPEVSIPFDLTPPERGTMNFIVPGKSGIGKTYLCAAHFPNRTLIVSSMDQLLQVSSQTKCIVYENMIFGPGTTDCPGYNLPYNQMENILDTQRTVWLDKKAGVRNKPAKLPAGRVQFFCINIDLLGTYFSDGEQQLDMNGQPLHVLPRIFPNDECKASQDTAVSGF